jgi:hypothetical protein
LFWGADRSCGGGFGIGRYPTENEGFTDATHEDAPEPTEKNRTKEAADCGIEEGALR